MSNQDFPDLTRGIAGSIGLSTDIDPDQAARALDLEDATGAQGTYIARNLDDFDKQYKQSLSRDIVLSNPRIMDYVRAHPLNGAISQNDFANLDRVSDSWQTVHGATSAPWWKRYPYLLARGAGGGTADVVAALGRIIGSENLAAKAQKIKESVESNTPLTSEDQSGIMAQILTGIGEMAPMAAAGVAAAAVGPELALPLGVGTGMLTAAGVGGLQHGEQQAEAAEKAGAPATSPFVGGLATGAAMNLLPLGIVTRPWETVAPGLINWGAAAFKRALASGTAIAGVGEVQQALDAEMARWTYNPDATYSPDTSRMLANMAMGMTMGVGFDAVKAYIDAGKPIPPGLNPTIDKLRFDHEKVTNQALDDLIGNVSTTDTPEHGPVGLQKLEEYLKLHPDISIGLDGRKALELYGDKQPAPDDNLLGWVSNIDAKLAAVRTSGGDIRVPLAEYNRAVRANPDLDKEFKDFRKVGKTGLSLDDVKNMTQAQQTEDEQRTTLRENPEIPRYVGGLTSTNVPVIDAVNKSLGVDRMLPMPSDFWLKQGSGLSTRTDLGLTNRGGTVALENKFREPTNVKVVAQTTGRDILKGIDLSGFDKLSPQTRKMMEFFRDRENEIAGDTPIYVLNQSGMKALRKGQSAGFYSYHEHHVVLNASYLDNLSDEYLAHVVIHEMSHAATYRELIEDPELMSKAVRLMDETKAWLIKNEPDSYDPNKISRFTRKPGAFKDDDVDYAFFLPNAGEFLAQAWADPKVMDAISRAEISPGLKSALNLQEKHNTVWEGIKAIVRSALERIFGQNIPSTIMDGVARWGEMVHAGRMGGKGLPPLPPGEYPEPPPPLPAEEKNLFADQKALGYTKASYDRIVKLVNEQRADIVKWKNELAQKEAEKYVTDWWKEESKKMEPAARREVYNQPVIAAERFLRFGYYGADKLTRRRLNGEFLTDQQKRDLEQDYWQEGRGGLNPDEVAPLFGYRSGDALISDLIGHSTDMRLNNMNPTQWVAKLVKDKTQQMMEEKHGSQSENILKEAQDRAISLGAINLAHEDLIRVGTLAGIQSPITREQLRDAAVKELNEADRRGDSSAEQLIDRAQKQGREVEQFLALGKNIEAYQTAQARQITLWKTYEMRDFEEIEEKALARAKRHVAREPETFKSENAAQFHDFIQMFMNSLGMRVNGDLDNWASAMKLRGFTDFRDFVETVNDPNYGLGGKTIPAPDWLKDFNFTKSKKIEDYTVGEAKSIWQTITAMDQMGRKQRTVDLNNKTLDREPILEGLKEAVRKSGPIIDTPAPDKPGKRHWLRLLDASTVIPERFFNRLDSDNPRGFWNQYFSRPLSESANHYDAMRKEYTPDFVKAGTPVDFTKPLKAPTILRNPSGQPWTSWTRENLITLAHNMGNPVNWQKMYKGWGLDDAGGAQLWSYVMRNMTEDEWKFVTKVGEIWNDAKRTKVDPVYLKTTGFPPRNISLWDVQTPYGTFHGWYYPLLKDRQAVGKGSKTGMETFPDGDDWFSLEVPNPHAQERTGRIYPLSLSMQHMPSYFDQMLYDVAFKENLGEVGKLWGDKSLQQLVINHQGIERKQMVDAFLQRLAHHTTFNSAAASEASRMNEFIRQNMMSFYVGFNISTVLKHGPTAFVNSARRIGVDNLLRGYSYLFKTNDVTGESWNDWVNRQEEIQRRSRDIAERFGGAYKDFTQSTLPESIRNWGSKPVAFVDMLSSKAEFLGAYLKALDDGQSEQEAIFEASRSVRYSHGSTAPTNTPLIATGSGLHSWATSLYHFFGTMLQNRVDMAFQLNKMYRLGREGELRTAANLIPGIMADVFAYVVFPTMIEEYVTGLSQDDRRGWGQRLMWASAGGLANAVPYARDIVHSLEYGVNQGGGLYDSAIQPMQQAMKDVAEAIEGKKQIYNAKFAGNLIQDVINLSGYRYGVPREVGNAAKYGWNVSTGVEVPHTGLMKSWFEWGDVGRGLTHGSQKMAVVR